MKPVSRVSASLALACLSFACLLFALPPMPALADDAPIDSKVMAAGYLAHHPDLRLRIDGMKALEAGFPGDAMTAFRRAAKYADKPSQAMLANMYWEGIGTPVDRPRGYAWMDIAAQRGYPDFIAWRERYWAALSPGERREAIEIGRPLMDEYGDHAAKPRLAAVLKRGMRQQTGSRIGSASPGLRILLVTSSAGGSTSGYIADDMGVSINGADYYQAKYWQPDAYFAWQDAQWGVVPSGNVEVQPLQRVPGGAGD